jgi:methylated-DNA-[protein]-cysteine S-methyltransferase
MEIYEIRDTPLGPVSLAASPAGMKYINYGTIEALFQVYPQIGIEHYKLINDNESHTISLLMTAKKEILSYLNGKLHDFSLPIDWSGMTPFQTKVRKACLAIPYGKTITYADLAKRAGFPNAVRAAGGANASNPLPLLIPCHRVIGSDGKLHGYGGPNGIVTKAWLLELEARS